MCSDSGTQRPLIDGMSPMDSCYRAGTKLGRKSARIGMTMQSLYHIAGWIANERQMGAAELRRIQ